MSGLQPVSMYSMRIPPGDFMLPAVPDHAAMLRITMAAVDPTEEPDFQDVEDKTERATLKIVRVPDELLEDDSDSEDDEDYSDEDDEELESDDEEGANGGPSDPKKIKKSTKQALLEALAADEEDEDEDEDDEDEDDEDDEKAGAKAIEKLKAAMKESKGKGKAVDGEDEDEDEDDDEDESMDSDVALGLDEVVICTLDTKTHYQQPLDLVIGEGERIFFKVSGTNTVHLTGNFVIPEDDGSASLYDEDDEDEDEDDISLDDEDAMDLLDIPDSESDELDDIEDPRITEVDSDEGPTKLIEAKKGAGKGKNKRPAEDSDDESDEPALDDIMSKALKNENIAAAAAAAGAPTTNGEPSKKLSKAEKKRQKKLKKNDGEAGAAPTVTETTVKKDTITNGTNGVEKKVQFAKNLEQGPTPSGNAKSSQTVQASSSPNPPSSSTANSDGTKKPSINIKTVQGITVDDRKMGSGPSAKKGSRLEMRYIGKLQSTNKIFDQNKSGKPFSFKMGAGEVIKGWDVGLQGMQAGGERRIIVPATMAYGNKALPDIPKNSVLVFDVKCLSVK